MQVSYGRDGDLWPESSYLELSVPAVASFIFFPFILGTLHDLLTSKWGGP